MAATGKKIKKPKWIPVKITEIIAEPTAIPNNWADSVEDEPENFGYASRTRAPVVLPSASRAACGGLAVDDESIPRRPPFVAYISNLPYDIDESAITELFSGLKITNLRLPREGDRLKGYGYVDFEDRESLINAMNIPDLTISGRRIRIEVSTHDNDRRMGRGGMGRSDRDNREYDPERTMGDWRSGPRAMPEQQQRARNPDREITRDRDITRERDPPRERDESSTDNRPGAWREGDRPAAAEPARAPYGGRDSFGRDRDRYGDDRGRERGFGGRDGFRPADRDREGYGSRDGGRGFGGRGFGDKDGPPRDEAKPRERPKLNLLPRTVPRDAEPAAGARPADPAPPDGADKPAPKPVPAEKVFGAAKPVDTAAKEREIEERLRKQEEEARRGADDKERWGRRTDHSGDRRGGARRDDRGRDSRSYNRDRRDYSKDGKDRDYRDDRDSGRDYSKDDKYRRDDRERVRRDYRDDSGRRGSRDHSADRRSDNSRDDRERTREDRERPYEDKERPREDRERPREDRERPREDRERPREDRERPREDRERPREDRERPREDRERPREDRERPREDRERPREDREKTREGRDREQPPRDERNGRARSTRSHDSDEREERPLPKLKEQEKPNFVATNKFGFLEDADDDGGSD